MHIGYIPILAGTVKLISLLLIVLNYHVNHVLGRVSCDRSTHILHINSHGSVDQLNRLIVVFLSWLRCPLVRHFVLFLS
jgi:hypothetical protein